MEHQSTDLRVKRTIKAIRTAFNQLILEKDFDNISITELSELANINRKTFYLHYSSLEDLINERRDEIVADFLDYVKIETKDLDVKGCISKFYHYLNECDNVEQKLLCDSNYNFFYEDVTEAMLESNSFKRFYQNTNHPYIIRAYCTTISSIFRSWMLNGKDIPIDELIDYSSNLILNGYNGTK